MSMIRTFLCLAVALAAMRSAAQDAEPVLNPETGEVLAVSELVVEAEEHEGGWLELTPLGSRNAPAVLIYLDDREDQDQELRIRPEVPPGASLLCTGAAGNGVLCEQIFLPGEAWVVPGESLAVPVRFESGMAVKGRYLLDGWPIAGARIAVVPTGLTSDRPFTMPLALELAEVGGAKIRREMISDDEGFFSLPQLAEGEYFLEAMLPSGRLHRGEPFGLPAQASLAQQADVGPGESLVWDLGEIDVADGLVVEFRVTNLIGEPIAGAWVAGRQGETAGQLISYQSLTNESGVAFLSGFSAEQGVDLSCRQSGYRAFEQHYALLPVLVSCVLEPLATVQGEVVGIDGLPLAEATVSLVRVPDESSATVSVQTSASPSVPSALVDAAGRFTVAELEAGEYRLHAAAPGLAVEERLVVLEPGQTLDLESIVLLPGRSVEGRVVDAETREPIVGAEIRAVSPVGAVSEVTGEDGEFTFATQVRQPLVLSLSSSDHVEREITVSPARLSEREPLVFDLERGGRLRVEVWDEATDLPCQSCRLMIQPSSQELMTGSAGEAFSAPLAPGWYRVHRPRISHLGSTVIARDDAEIRHARIRRGETSTVRFGERRDTVRVLFQPSPGPGWTLSARTPSSIEQYDPEPDGGFRVRYRRGESLDLFLHRFDAETGTEIEVRQAGVSVESETGELRLPVATGQLSGRLTSNSETLPGVRIRLRTLELATHATVHSRADGTFQIPHLPPGVYAVVVGERIVQFASLRGGQSLDVGTFDLVPGSY